ncbi:MAG: hypothetical protein KY475_03570 [Planctomycetes bacterium]|nr:hypothetical protein [Planctomycetota bacterium]
MTRWSPLAISTLALVTLAQSFPAAAPAQDMQVAPVGVMTNRSNYAEQLGLLEDPLSGMRSQGPYDAPVGAPHHGCNGCACNPCPSCCRTSGLYGGAEALWIKPHFQDESAFVIDGSRLDEVVPFDYDFEASPRFWLGYVGCSGLGARARYWTFDGDSTASGVFVDDGEAFAFSAGDVLRRRLAAGPGDAAFAQHDLELETIDLEATQQFNRANLMMLAGAGLRYVRVEQDYLVQFTDPLGPQDSLLHNHDFEGIGPTAALELWRPIGGYGFSLYGALRGSVLFGELNQQITETTGGLVFTERRHDVDETLAIGEVALGLQWTGAGIYNTDFFVRSGWEGQYWNGAGNANSTEGDMGLQGLTLAIGLMR